MYTFHLFIPIAVVNYPVHDPLEQLFFSRLWMHFLETQNFRRKYVFLLLKSSFLLIFIYFLFYQNEWNSGICIWRKAQDVINSASKNLKRSKCKVFSFLPFFVLTNKIIWKNLLLILMFTLKISSKIPQANNFWGRICFLV